MTASEFEEKMKAGMIGLFDALIARGAALRTIGIRVVQYADVRIEIDPAVELQGTPTMATIDQPSHSDALDDPATYGLKDRAPGFDLTDMPDE